jgi:site-specific DNA-methyltransferase (adenine-specific)
VEIYTGDCREILSMFYADNSVDAIVTDPPYGLSFMGKKWDYEVPGVDVWAGCLRVLKPGGYLLSFAGTRTQHRMAVNIEDAGFEIRDMIAWVYGSGFPKSHNGEWGGTALKPAL